MSKYQELIENILSEETKNWEEWYIQSPKGFVGKDNSGNYIIDCNHKDMTTFKTQEEAKEVALNVWPQVIKNYPEKGRAKYIYASNYDRNMVPSEEPIVKDYVQYNKPWTMITSNYHNDFYLPCYLKVKREDKEELVTVSDLSDEELEATVKKWVDDAASEWEPDTEDLPGHWDSNPYGVEPQLIGSSGGWFVDEDAEWEKIKEEMKENPDFLDNYIPEVDQLNEELVDKILNIAMNYIDTL